MAQRIYRFDLVSPTGTTVVNNVTDRLEFPAAVVTAITVEIPGGHAGKTGIAIFFGFNQIIPLGGDAWLKGNKKTTRYDFDDPFPGDDNWFAVHFNTDHYVHTFHLAFEVDALALGLSLPPVVLLPQVDSAPEVFGDDTTPSAPVPVVGGVGRPGPVPFE